MPGAQPGEQGLCGLSQLLGFGVEKAQLQPSRIAMQC